MSTLQQRRLRSLESLVTNVPPSWEKIFDSKARLLAGLALVESRNMCGSQEDTPMPLTEQGEDYGMSVEAIEVPEMLWDSGTSAEVHNDYSKAGHISIKVESMSEDVMVPSVSSPAKKYPFSMSVEPSEEPQPLWIGAGDSAMPTEPHKVEIDTVKVENMCEGMDELSETFLGQIDNCGMPVEPLEVIGGTWYDDGDAERYKECIKVRQELVKVESTCGDSVVHPEFHKDDSNVPGEPLTVPESSESIGRASNSAHMWANVEARSTSSDDSREDCDSSSEEETLQGYVSKCNKIIFKNTSLSKFPKKFVFRNHTKPHASRSFSDFQRSTFVRIDYNKRRSSRLKLNRVPPANPAGCRSSRVVFEQAYIKDNVYHCSRVKKGMLLEPYVDLGFRCDDIENHACTNPKAGDRLSAKKPSTVKRSQKRYSLRIRSSEHDNSFIEESLDNGNKMIRVDYCRKNSSCLSEKPLSTGSLTYINDKDKNMEQLSRSSSPINSLDDEAALGERLYLSESEDGDNSTVKSVKEMTSESLKSIFVDDSERFLKRLVKHLNAGGFSCQLCDTKIDWQGVLAEIYNWEQGS